MTDPTAEQIADRLDRAAEYIEEHGHCKGRTEDAEGRVCAMGALARSNETGREGGYYYFSSIEEVEKYIQSPNLAHWNDAPEREPFEVVDAFRHTAKHLRGGAS